MPLQTPVNKTFQSPVNENINETKTSTKTTTKSNKATQNTFFKPTGDACFALVKQN